MGRIWRAYTSRSTLSRITGFSDEELARGLDRLGLLKPLERLVHWLAERLPEKRA